MAEITDHLREAIINLCWAAVPYGEDEDGWITRYLIGSGWVHQLVGAAQGAGIPAAFRAIGHELNDGLGAGEKLEP